MEMSIEGLESLMAKLRRLGGSVDEAIDKGIGKGVQKIKSDAKVNCPYDTGRLKGSISTEHLELKVWAVGTNVEYAMFVEFGTGQHGAPGVPHTMQPWRYKDAKGKVCIEGMCTVVLRSVYKDGRYVFLTNKQDDKCLEKSPIDMFAETAIDNDLKMVDNTIREYYNITEDKVNA